FISDFKNLDLVYRGMLAPLIQWYISGYFFIIKKSVYDEAGGFSTQFAGSSVEDIEFGYRVCGGKSLITRNRDITVDHLKRYTFWSMIKTDFKRIINMVGIRVQSKGKYGMTEHTPINYFINILLPGFFGLSLLGGIFFPAVLWAALALPLIFALNNSGFLSFLKKRRGSIFSFKSIVVMFLEYTAVCLAIFYSYILYFTKYRDKRGSMLDSG
ncbi:MAG: hypothetical protein GY757_56510, partial [bacterium]|nr:hypothetical protein [bacterium]